MNNHLLWTSTLIHSLYKKGVRHAVISPGSRSTPLTIAAAIHPDLKDSVVLDERSAAFIALGIAKQTGVPALLICTSGTAAANYFPAVIEARESGIPMIILSADRPPNLRGTGSSQTIDQIKLFGSQAVFFHEAGEPRTENSDLARLKFLATQAVETAISEGGAAHINMPFRKPLEPTQEQIREAEKIFRNSSTTKDAPAPAFVSEISFSKSITQLFSSCRRPLIIAGPCDRFRSLNKQALKLSEKLNAPLIPEPGSNISGNRFRISRYEQYFRDSSFLEKMKPDLIIRFGDQPFTKSLLTALEHWQDVPALHIASRPSWQDQVMTVTHRIICRKNDQLNLSKIRNTAASAWFMKWKEAEKKAASALDTVFDGIKKLSDGHIFSHLNKQLPEEWNIMLSNSFPVRDMALFAETRSGQFVNRGAAGIDGIVSTGLGIHLSSEKPTCCIVGDLAFLHDSNALLSLINSGRPFLVIVVNNGGGTIFRMLPVHQQNDLYETYFETPQHADIEYLAKAHNISYRKISTPDELQDFNPGSVKGSAIVECVTNSGLSMELRKKLWDD